MSLHIESLVFDEFRGYSHLELSNLSALTVIEGDNAVGKTNIVEGIQLLSSGTSFRKPAWGETVSWGQNRARLSARFSDGKRLVEHVLTISGNERVYEVNGKRKPASAVGQTCPCVLFIPDDLQLVKASSAARRAALDDVGVQLSRSYASLKGDYQQVLRQRNLLVRDGISDPVLLASWNESLAVAGARLAVNRWRLLERLAGHFERIYAELVDGERAWLRYIPSWERFDETGRQVAVDAACDPDMLHEAPEVEEAEERLLDCMQRFSEVESRRKASLFGPHKDELAFYIAGKNARMFASQGQQRTLVLAFKLACVELVGEVVEQNPILLLDDVMSELDAAHRSALSNFVAQAAQTFMTTANLGYFEDGLLARADVVHVPIPGTRHAY